MRNRQNKNWLTAIAHWFVIILAILAGKTMVESANNRKVDASGMPTDTGDLPSNSFYYSPKANTIIVRDTTLTIPEDTYVTEASYEGLTLLRNKNNPPDPFLKEVVKVLQGKSSKKELNEFISKAKRKYEITSTSGQHELFRLFSGLLEQYPTVLELYVEFFKISYDIVDPKYLVEAIITSNLSTQDKLTVFEKIAQEHPLEEVQNSITFLRKTRDTESRPIFQETFIVIILTALTLLILRTVYPWRNRRSAQLQQDQSPPRTLDDTSKSVKQKSPSPSVPNPPVELESSNLEAKQILIGEIKKFLSTYHKYTDHPKFSKNFSKVNNIKDKIEKDVKNSISLDSSRTEFEQLSKRLTANIQYMEFLENFNNLLLEHKDSLDYYDLEVQKKKKKVQAIKNERIAQYEKMSELYTSLKNNKANLDHIFSQEFIDYNASLGPRLEGLSASLLTLQHALEREKLFEEIAVFLKQPIVSRCETMESVGNNVVKKIQEAINAIRELKKTFELEKDPRETYEKHVAQFKLQCATLQKMTKSETSTTPKKKTPSSSPNALQKPETSSGKVIRTLKQSKKNQQTEVPAVSQQSSNTAPTPVLQSTTTNQGHNKPVVILRNFSPETWVAQLQEHIQPAKPLSDEKKQPVVTMSERRWKEFEEIYNTIQLLTRTHYDFNNLVDKILYFLRCHYYCTRFAVVMAGTHHYQKIRSMLVHLMEFHSYDNSAAANAFWAEKTNAIHQYAENIVTEYAKYMQSKALLGIHDFEQTFIKQNTPKYRDKQMLHRVQQGNLLDKDLTLLETSVVKPSAVIATQIRLALGFIKEILFKDSLSSSDLQREYPDRFMALKQLLAFLGEQFNYLHDHYYKEYKNWLKTFGNVAEIIKRLRQFRNQAYHDIREPAGAIELGYKLRGEQQVGIVAALESCSEWEIDLRGQNLIAENAITSAEEHMQMTTTSSRFDA